MGTHSWKSLLSAGGALSDEQLDRWSFRDEADGLLEIKQKLQDAPRL